MSLSRWRSPSPSPSPRRLKRGPEAAISTCTVSRSRCHGVGRIRARRCARILAPALARRAASLRSSSPDDTFSATNLFPVAGARSRMRKALSHPRAHSVQACQQGPVFSTVHASRASARSVSMEARWQAFRQRGTRVAVCRGRSAHSRASSGIGCRDAASAMADRARRDHIRSSGGEMAARLPGLIGRPCSVAAAAVGRLRRRLPLLRPALWTSASAMPVSPRACATSSASVRLHGSVVGCQP
mmetsp:Transcript_18935/g.55584  ORF Transcript_18935/g.55584 Transcript_18935/m.55584 type:complete len:243 (+) Transcript_18935:308-1036(+)